MTYGLSTTLDRPFDDTVTAVRDTAPTPVTVTATTPAGVGSATFDIVQMLSVVASDRELTPVADDGLTFVATFVA